VIAAPVRKIIELVQIFFDLIHRSRKMPAQNTRLYLTIGVTFASPPLGRVRTGPALAPEQVHQGAFLGAGFGVVFSAEFAVAFSVRAFRCAASALA